MLLRCGVNNPAKHDKFQAKHSEEQQQSSLFWPTPKGSPVDPKSSSTTMATHLSGCLIPADAIRRSMMIFPKWLPWHFGVFLSLSPRESEIFRRFSLEKLLNLRSLRRLLWAYVIATGNVMNY